MTRTLKLQTYLRLGLSNIARVAVYRLGLKSGRHPVQRLQAPVAEVPFFRATERGGDIPPPNPAWENVLWQFGWHSQSRSETPPDWFSNPFSDAPQPDASRDWWRIADFGSGDIKGLWELSRFDWVVAWATVAAQGDAQAVARLNLWIADWAASNPPYKGPNWKCGQEASIRVMHLVAAAWVLGQDRTPEEGLTDLVRAHLQRIAPTMSYAIGQQNNHGTSEAAALFIGGSFLLGHDPRAEAWLTTGRHWLEERAAALIDPDGSFSQYSTTYHRVVLDTYSLAEAWRRHRQMPGFSVRLRTRLGAATRWLYTLVDAETGDAPNIGANDGARLLQLVDADYRDFRPSVQLAAALFLDGDAFGSGHWNVPLRWLGVGEGSRELRHKSETFDGGGYHVLRHGKAMAVMRYPRFKFRPSHADALHVDLWHSGANLLRDAGTYSYNADGSDWFSSTAAHNTITFDDRDQMPRLGRFLFGGWIDAERVKAVRVSDTATSARAAYTDGQGARHEREIELTDSGLICRDRISGNFKKACLRWRLAPGSWRSVDDVLSDGTNSIYVELEGVPVSLELGSTAESRYYQRRCTIPMASLTVERPSVITTRVTF